MSKARPVVLSGATAGLRPWTRAEIAVVDRFARALAAGRYRSTLPAAIDCRQALAALPGSVPVRTLVAVRRYMDDRCHRLGLRWAMSFWTPPELALARRHARAFMRGRYPTLRDAARECQRRLAADLGCERTLEGCCWHLGRAMRELGIPAQDRDYTTAEKQVIERHSRMLFTGEMRSVTEAVRACRRELCGRRTAVALRMRIKMLVAGKELPRSHGFMTDAELKVVEEYARKVARGELPTWRAAGPPCHEELQHRQSELARAAPGKVSPDYGRDVTSVYGAVVRAATRLGLREKLRHAWTEDEERRCDAWRRWYLKYHRVRRLRPLSQAAEGLQEELAELGVHRSVGACTQRILRYGKTPL